MNKNIPTIPEITKEYKQQEYQAVLDAEVIYEFELLKEPKVEISIIIFFSIISLLTFWWSYLDTDLAWVIILLNMTIWGTYLSSGNPQVEQKVTLTKKGLILSELELIPEGFYVALRSTGYIIAGFCIITVFFLGPMMLVGAGAGALMSFKMTGAQRKAKVKAKPFHVSPEYVLSTYKEESFKNELKSYDYSLLNESSEIPHEQTNFFYFRYSAFEEDHKIMYKEIKKIINTSKEYDEL